LSASREYTVAKWSGFCSHLMEVRLVPKVIQVAFVSLFAS
jgi:hypothetical protein